MNLTLYRIYKTTATFGVLCNDEWPLCVTLELPSKSNLPDISCIPEGVYQCVPHDSPAHSNTWEITNVPDRSDILIHNGNFLKNTSGCIICGSQFYGNMEAVGGSDMAMSLLRRTLPSSFSLTIKGAS